VLKLLKKSVVDKRTAAIFLIVMAGSLFLHISPVWFVVVSAVAGILLKNLEGRAAK
jgi:chromate transporter